MIRRTGEIVTAAEEAVRQTRAAPLGEPQIVCTDFPPIKKTYSSFDATFLLLFSAHLPHSSSFVVTLRVA